MNTKSNINSKNHSISCRMDPQDISTKFEVVKKNEFKKNAKRVAIASVIFASHMPIRSYMRPIAKFTIANIPFSGSVWQPVFAFAMFNIMKYTGIFEACRKFVGCK